jgi:tetratricopeptide (TPR) repeat protein
MLLLAAEMLVPESGPLALPAAAALSLVFSGCGGEKSAVDLWRGNRDYSAGRYEEALDRYASAAARNPKDPRAPFNAGDAQYRLKNLDEAAERFAKLADPKRSPAAMLPSANYNLGVTRFAKGDCPGAAEAFKQCLLLDSSDEDCRFNLVKALDCMNHPTKGKSPDTPDDQHQKHEKQNEAPRHGRNRPRQDMSQEDAERILQAIREREKAAKAHEQEQRQANQPPEGGAGGNDW